jgi:galactokinase/mevalonate kinase-like predicted kinase
LRINQSDTIAQDRYAAALGGIDAIFAMKFSSEH